MNIPLNIDWQQILLHLFNFSLLAGGLYLLLYRPVKRFMDEREAHYRAAKDEAETLTAQAEKLRSEYGEKLAAAEADIARRISEADLELEQYRAQEVEKAKQEADKIITRARESALRERAEIIAEAKKDLTEAAAAAAEKIALGDAGDPYEQFLSLVERGSGDEPAK